MAYSKDHRGEIACAFVLIAIVIAGLIAYFMHDTLVERQQKNRIAEITTTTPASETVAVFNPEGEYTVSWTGTVLVTLLDSRWYESEAAARAAENLGHDCEPHTSNSSFLVCELQLENVDAAFSAKEVTGVESFDESEFNLRLPTGERSAAVTLYTEQPMVEYEKRATSSFELYPGESATIKLGFMLPSNNPTDDLTLLLGSGLFQFPVDVSPASDNEA